MKKWEVLPLDLLQIEADRLRNSFDPTHVEGRLRALLRYYRAVTFNLKQDAPFHRVQRCESERGWTEFARVHYPPPHMATAQRLSDRGRPLLYAAMDLQTALAETDAKAGDYVHAVGYELRPGSEINCLVVGELENAHKSGRCFPAEVTPVFRGLLQRSPRAAGLSAVFMDSLFASILSDREAEKTGYLHSRTLARLLYECNPKAHAIMYPSVARPKAVNLAIRPEAADTLLQPMGTSVLFMRAAYDFGLYEFDLVRDAAAWPQVGPIVWRDIEMSNEAKD